MAHRTGPDLTSPLGDQRNAGCWRRFATFHLPRFLVCHHCTVGHGPCFELRPLLRGRFSSPTSQWYLPEIDISFHPLHARSCLLRPRFHNSTLSSLCSALHGCRTLGCDFAHGLRGMFRCGCMIFSLGIYTYPFLSAHSSPIVQPQYLFHCAIQLGRGQFVRANKTDTDNVWALYFDGMLWHLPTYLGSAIVPVVQWRSPEVLGGLNFSLCESLVSFVHHRLSESRGDPFE